MIARLRVLPILLFSASLLSTLLACTLPVSSDLYGAASRKTAVRVTGISLNAAALPISFATTAQLVATVAPATASNKAVTWASGNAGLATVSSTGLVTAGSAAGTVTITAATQDGGFTASCTFTVSAAPVAVTAVAINPPSATVAAGATRQLAAVFTPASATNQNVTWSSSDSLAASVDATGLVTALGSSGTVTITVTTQDGGFTATCTVTLTAAVVAVTGVTVAPTTLTLAQGSTAPLTATVAPAAATNQGVTWSSSNTAVVSVSAAGLVTAVTGGTATITVTTVDGGFTAPCSVTVQTWQPPLGGAVPSGTADSGVTMALDSVGTPYIAFRDSAGRGLVEVFNSGTSTWDVVGTVPFASSITVSASATIGLALDSLDRPYVAFQDPTVGNKVTVMRFNGISWVLVGSAPGISTGVANYVSLAVDGTTPYVSYVDNGLSDRVTIQFFNGSAWTPEGSAGFSNPSSAYTSTAVKPGVGYVAYGNGSGFAPEVVANNSLVGGLFATSSSAFYISLAIDPNTGTFYVAFEDSAASDFLSVWKSTGGSWTQLGSGVSPGQVNFTSIAVASDGSLYVAFQDLAAGGKATVMKYDGTSWQVVVSAGISAGAATDVTVKTAAGHVVVCYDVGGSISVQELQ